MLYIYNNDLTKSVLKLLAYVFAYVISWVSQIVLWPTRRSFFQKLHFCKQSHLEAQLGLQKGENDPKMASQNDPKTTKNRCQKMIKILIDFKTAGTIFLERPGGMRWPPGGIIGGARNTLFEIFERLGIL